MKFNRGTIAALLSAAAISVSGVTALAADSKDTAKTEMTDKKPDRAPKELSDEEKANMLSEMKERFAQELADGKITQDDYDEAIAAIENGEMPKPKDKPDGEQPPELTDEQKEEMLSNAKETLSNLLSESKITQDDYDEAIEEINSGNMPKLLEPKEHNHKFDKELSEEEKVNMLSEMKERLSKELADGKITQDDYDEAIAAIENGEMPKPKDKPDGEQPPEIKDNDSSNENAPDGKQPPELTDEQKEKMLSKSQEMIDKLLSEGKLTQEDYDKAQEDINNGNMPRLPRPDDEK